MTKQEVIDAFKTELSKTYTIQTSRFSGGKLVETVDTEYPNAFVNFNREVIEAALRLLEESYDL